MPDQPLRRSPRVPPIRGTQVGLRNRSLVGEIKAAIQAGRYAYEEPRGQIGGELDRKGNYHIGEGHHRMAAAMEIYKETGDPNAVLELLRWGRWTLVEQGPPESRPLPSRYWWGAIRNWLSF